jgi:hypothetical protein
MWITCCFNVSRRRFNSWLKIAFGLLSIGHQSTFHALGLEIEVNCYRQTFVHICVCLYICCITNTAVAEHDASAPLIEYQSYWTRF